MTLSVKDGTSQEMSWFKDTFDTYYESIRDFAYFKTGDTDFADDVVQETFLKLWSYRKKVRQSTVKSLLYTIAGNIIKNQFKHKKVVYQFVRQFDQDNEAESADSIMLSNEFSQVLQNALTKIPEKSRIVFMMNRIEGLTYNEIAQRMNLSVKAVEKRISQAIHILRSNINYRI